MSKLRTFYFYLGSWLMTTSLLAQTTADDIIVGSGNDGTKELDIVNTILQTGQRTILFGIGPLGGSWLIYKGFQMIGNADRGDKMPGVVTMVCGGACFILGPIVANFVDAAQV